MSNKMEGQLSLPSIFVYEALCAKCLRENSVWWFRHFRHWDIWHFFYGRRFYSPVEDNISISYEQCNKLMLLRIQSEDKIVIIV